ncbi:MAG: hypothetical protein KF859_13670 [Phycisphaeraceae bacterium]|nr:hypothetical protein [Phycisphaeraceae bacterium]
MTGYALAHSPASAQPDARTHVWTWTGSDAPSVGLATTRTSTHMPSGRPCRTGAVSSAAKHPECVFDFEGHRFFGGPLEGQQGFWSVQDSGHFDVQSIPTGMPMDLMYPEQYVFAFSNAPGDRPYRVVRRTACLAGRTDISFDIGVQVLRPGSEVYTGWFELGTIVPTDTPVSVAAIGIYRFHPSDADSPLGVFVRGSSADGVERFAVIETPLSACNPWARVRVGVDFDLNRLLDINITTLRSGDETSSGLHDLYISGGTLAMAPVDHFGLVVAPDGSYAMGFDNIRIEPLTDRPTPCPADYNNDGGVDGADVEAFFADWEQGLPAADVNFDGGVDGADIEVFLCWWEAGGCPT